MVMLDSSGNEVIRVRGTDLVAISTLSFDPKNGGGTVVLPGNLAAGYTLGLFLDDEAPIQNYHFRDKTSFTLRRFEDALDNIMGVVQTLVLRSKQALRIGDFDDENAIDNKLPPLEDAAERIILVNDTGDGFRFGPRFSDVGGGVGTTPDADPIAHDYATFDEDADPVYESGVFSGFSARFNAQIEALGFRDAILQIFNFQYLGPQISLSSAPAQTLREKGSVVASATLTADTTKRSEDITEVRFYRGATLIYTDLAPSANGSANSSYVDNTPFSDNISYSAQVLDGVGAPVVSNTVSYPFVYPYYWGASVPGLTAAQVAVLGGAKQIIANTNNRVVTYTVAIGDIVYFAYPAAYGALTSIKDQNGFEAISGFTATTENITGLDGTVQSYRLYKLNNVIGVAGTTTYTFQK